MQQSTTLARPKIEGVIGGRFRIAMPGEVWERVLPGLIDLHRSYLSQDWDIELVRDMLEQDHWMLIVDEENPGSFAIVRVNESPYHDDEMEMFIVLAYHKGQEMKALFLPHLEAIARQAGVKHIRFHSRRRGMLRLVADFGYKPFSIEYVKEL